MFLTSRILLKTDENTDRILAIMANSYQNEVNRLIQLYIDHQKEVYVPYQNFCTFIPFWSKKLIVQEAKHIYSFVRKYNNKKLKMHNPACCWHQPNFKIYDHQLEIQVGGRFGIGEILKLDYIANSYQQKYLQMPLGKMTIHRYKKWWVADFNVQVSELPVKASSKRMGIDLGMKVPAVAYTEEGKVKFFGNGREARFRRYAFYAKLTKYQKAGDLKKCKALNHELYRWFYSECHRISREIVDFAVSQDIGILCFEQLHGIGIREGTSSHFRRDLNQWCYYRLIKNTEYKAKREGIRLVYVDPRYTSRRCPACGRMNSPTKRIYQCSCGFRGHRDLIGAMNIVHAPESGHP